jgi:hypothetical protein
MDELRAEARTFDDVPGCAVDLIPAKLAAVAGRALHEIDPGVAPLAGRGKGSDIQVGHNRPREAHPSDVSKDCAGRRHLAPEVEQNKLVGIDRPTYRRRRLIMRIASVLLRRDAGRRIGDKSLFSEPFHHRLLHVVLAQLPAASGSYQLECAILDPVESLGCGAVCRQCLIRPNCLEALDEIS